MNYFLIGLDLGQTQDYTAVAVLECFAGATLTYHLRHLERPERGTPYPVIAARTQALADTPPLAGRVRVIADATGVGVAVMDLLRQTGLPLVPVSITAGDAETYSNGVWRVPKRDLVFSLLTTLQTNRLRIAESLPLAETLVAELLNFRVKINLQTAHDSYAAWREGEHDDLVLAVALACWWGEQHRPPPDAVRGDPEIAAALSFSLYERPRAGRVELVYDRALGRSRFVRRRG